MIRKTVQSAAAAIERVRGADPQRRPIEPARSTEPAENAVARPPKCSLDMRRVSSRRFGSSALARPFAFLRNAHLVRPKVCASSAVLPPHPARSNLGRPSIAHAERRRRRSAGRHERVSSLSTWRRPLQRSAKTRKVVPGANRAVSLIDLTCPRSRLWHRFCLVRPLPRPRRLDRSRIRDPCRPPSPPWRPPTSTSAASTKPSALPTASLRCSLGTGT
jgi:hypothetical protein